MSRTTRRRGTRIVGALLLLCLTGGAYGYLVSQLRTATNADTRFVASEQAGMTFLRPLLKLVGELSDAGVAAVSGQNPGFEAVNAAVTEASQADSAVGSQLGTQQRWKDLKTRVDRLATTKPVGAAAFQQYGETTSLAKELVLRVGDTSHLILDPDLDSYYLADVVLVRLPNVMLSAARAAGEAALGAAAAPGSPEQSKATVAIAVGRFEVATAADAVSTSLRKAQDATQRPSLGQNLTTPLDEFRTAVDVFSPPPALLPQASNVDSPALQGAAQKVLQASAALSKDSLAELTALLDLRRQGLADAHYHQLLAAVIGVAMAVVLLWWATPIAGMAQTAGRMPAEESEQEPTLRPVQPQELLDAEELLHVGRGVRVRSREWVNDAW